MIPYVGQTVLVEGIHANGCNVHPAIITRNWAPGMAAPVCVNLTVLPDNELPITRTSVMVFGSRKDALAGGQGLVAYPVEA